VSESSNSALAAAVVVAGGTGERFGDVAGKQLAVVEGAPVLAYALRAFMDCEVISEIVVVVHPDRVFEFTRALASAGVNTDDLTISAGGETRQRSVANGLSALVGQHEVVVVHDGARPMVTVETITAAVSTIDSKRCDGVVVGHPSFDTLKLVDGDRITDTPDRSSYWVVQTPQAFRLEMLRAAHDSAENDGYLGTDDASLVERLGGDVRVLEGPRENIKVTVPADLGFVEAVVRSRNNQG
jgi:2-C-methyl-D-erythritol 4-phosphate cytidylyltransferase